MIHLVVVLLAALTATRTARITGQVTGAPGSSVVYIQAIPGQTFPAPAQHALMDQQNMTFIPHVLVVQVGTTVDFRNSDRVPHNIFWASVGGNRKLGRNLGTWPLSPTASPQGGVRSFRFDNDGVVPLLCDRHPAMSAHIVVTPTPYFSQTDSAGNFAIAGVPEGTYTVTAWHQGMPTQSRRMTVAKGDARADFTLTK